LLYPGESVFHSWAKTKCSQNRRSIYESQSIHSTT